MCCYKMYFTVYYKDFIWLPNPSDVFVTNSCKKSAHEILHARPSGRKITSKTPVRTNIKT
jgi:hypothetical protein